jgi:hypothetical protein
MLISDNGRGRAVHIAFLVLGMGLAGCASPGPPQPPSLKLPEIVSVTSLTATRVGSEVRLHWTTPTRTTDKLLIAGPITAEICRDTVQSANSTQNPRRNPALPPCSVIAHVQVTPGPSDSVDPLPPALISGPARLLAYRVQLKNAAGRTAGPSPAVFAASGPVPQPIENWRGRPSKLGAVLEWKSEPANTESIELDRTLVESPAEAAAPKTNAADDSHRNSLLGAQKDPRESRLRVDATAGGAVDAGGTIDRSARIGHSYRYTAQRVRTVAVGGQTLEVRSVPTAEVTVTMREDFPPDAPTGLVAAPGFTGEEAARRPAIDLSWEPNTEPRIAGYRVYRRDAEQQAWQQLDSSLVAVAAYRDSTVVAGHRYAYRVTAVNVAGIESPHSEEVLETAPAE